MVKIKTIEEMMTSKFRNSPMGFAMTFENGWTLSVQWGPGNYCQARSEYSPDKNPFDGLFHSYTSPNAEIAAWDKDGNWTKLSSHDDGKGWVAGRDVCEYIAMISHPEFGGMDEGFFQAR